jgi:hypothetical protein
MACGGSSDATAPPPEPGKLVFKLDPATCTSYAVDPINIALLIGSVPVDTLDMVAGDTASFGEPAGDHLVSAHQTTAHGMDWPNHLVTVPAGASFTWLLTC